MLLNMPSPRWARGRAIRRLQRALGGRGLRSGLGDGQKIEAAQIASQASTEASACLVGGSRDVALRKTSA